MFRLAHISDPHLGPLPEIDLADLANKRIFGLVNWRRNRKYSHAPDVLQALCDDIRAQGADHVAVTGDLVNLGLPAEFVAARAWLECFGAGRDVTVVPGNHDAYIPGALDDAADAWADFMSGDGADGEVAFPFVRRRGRVALIGMSSAIPTAPLMATGEIGGGQAAALASRLTSLKRSGHFRVILIHHPPESPPIAWSRRLIDGDLFRRAVADAGAELILHGHNHRTRVNSIPGRDGPVPVIGAAAASLSPRQPIRAGGSYCLFEIDDAAEHFSCRMIERGVRQAGGRVETLSEHRLAARVRKPAQPAALTHT
ncbi:MAG TPA: metallophosphoesterase [Bauldia sp.]|nr:metallophosphoesterase [Bauldia sp.]